MQPAPDTLTRSSLEVLQVVTFIIINLVTFEVRLQHQRRCDFLCLQDISIKNDKVC